MAVVSVCYLNVSLLLVQPQDSNTDGLKVPSPEIKIMWVDTMCLNRNFDTSLCERVLVGWLVVGFDSSLTVWFCCLRS